MRELRLARLPMHAMFCAACILQFASEARAQCAARDVLQNQLKLKKAPSASAPPVLVRSVTDVLVWKTITLGTFADSFTLRNALDTKGCNIGFRIPSPRNVFVLSVLRNRLRPQPAAQCWGRSCEVS